MKVSGLADSPLFVKPKGEKEKQPSNHTTSVSCNNDTMVASISNAVREVGREASTYRFTSNEKKALAEIIYTFRMKNIRISENEIARIAVHYLINDYKEKINNSILSRVWEIFNINK
jgi:hypothetical protein